jgi:hypothetical protein
MNKLLIITLLISTNTMSASTKARELKLPTVIDSFCIEKPKGKQCIINYDNGESYQITYDRKGNILNREQLQRGVK